MELPESGDLDGKDSIYFSNQVITAPVLTFLVVVCKLWQHIKVNSSLITSHGFYDETPVLSKEEERATGTTIVCVASRLLLIGLKDLLSIVDGTERLY